MQQLASGRESGKCKKTIWLLLMVMVMMMMMVVFIDDDGGDDDSGSNVNDNVDRR